MDKTNEYQITSIQKRVMELVRRNGADLVTMQRMISDKQQMMLRRESEILQLLETLRFWASPSPEFGSASQVLGK